MSSSLPRPAPTAISSSVTTPPAGAPSIAPRSRTPPPGTAAAKPFDQGRQCSLLEGQDRLQPIDRSAVPSDAIRDIALEPSGAFWLATNDGVARNAPRLWRAPDTVPQFDATVFRIRDDGAGGLWLLTEQALIHHSGDKWETIPFPEQWTPLVLRNSSLLVLRDGSLALPRAGKIGRFDPRTRSFRKSRRPVGAFLEMMTPRGDGTAWTVPAIPTSRAFSSASSTASSTPAPTSTSTGSTAAFCSSSRIPAAPSGSAAPTSCASSKTARSAS